jgi:hypothetical protein
MRPSRRPPLRMSRMFPNYIRMDEGWPTKVGCPTCGLMQNLARRMYGGYRLLATHRGADGRSRCPGSGWRIDVDETAEQWRRRLLEAVTETALIR